MAEFIIMPKLGFNMDKGKLLKWLKREGDTVKKGEVVFEIETDKTTMEIEVTSDGILLKLLVEEGQTVPVTLPVAIVGTAGENIANMITDAGKKLGDLAVFESESSEVRSEETATVKEEVTATAGTSNLLKLSPRARKYAAEQGLDLSGAILAGTGFQGGVTKKDLEQHAKNHKITPLAKKMADTAQIDVSTLSGTGFGGKIIKDDIVSAMSKTEKADICQSISDIEVLHTYDYSGMRKVIGDRLSQSKFTAPHLYFTASIDVTELVRFRELLNKSQQQKVSYNDFVIAAVSKALQKYPEVNCSLQDGKIIQYKDVNIGMAVALEKGLIVPVIRKTQKKNLTALAAETQALAEKARAGKLLPQDYQGGTFTVSNLGMYDIENFTAIINPPEAAILSVSAMKKVPVVVGNDTEDKIVVRTIMKVTLSVDHRLIDGMNATRFLNEVKMLLEKPLTILI